jgi:uncharacterized protein (TIGR03083 family)
MNKDQIWTHIHSERATLADTWEGLTAEQWSQSSWCTGWSIQELAGHVLSAAEQTFPNFYKEFIGAKFKFDVFADKGAKALAPIGPEELIRRLRARTSTTNHPPAPVIAMLGEIVVHGEDTRRPLGLNHTPPMDAVVAIADNWKKTNILIGSKRRIAGLQLKATDVDWVHGDGPEVSGPMVSLLLAMAGRKGALADLSGDGVAILTARP